MQEQIEISSQEGVAIFVMQRLNAIFLPASGYGSNFESASTENKRERMSTKVSSGQSWETIEILSGNSS